FQAEDGIRDRDVTGVQTCALPIFGKPGRIDADAVGWQHARRAPVVQADVEAHDRVPRVDSLDVAALPDPGGGALITPVAEVLVAWQPGSARRRQSAAD